MFDLAWAFAAPGVLWMLLALVVPHGTSCFVHDLLGGEGARTTLQPEMVRPYVRVFVMHLTVILGGAALILSGAPALALVGLVLVKATLDLASHLRAHVRSLPPE